MIGTLRVKSPNKNTPLSMKVTNGIPPSGLE